MAGVGRRDAVRRATEGDVDAIARTLAAAFQDEGVSRWLIPDPVERADLRPRQFAVLVGHAIRHGAVYTTDDYTAAMVWFDRTRPAPLSPDDQRRLIEAQGRWASRFKELRRLFDRHQPTEPHHYLLFSGVLPAYWRTGLHTALLLAHHETLDRDQICAFSEAPSKEVVKLAERHGYRSLGDPFTLPNGAELWPIWRTPRPR